MKKKWMFVLMLVLIISLSSVVIADTCGDITLEDNEVCMYDSSGEHYYVGDLACSEPLEICTEVTVYTPDYPEGHTDNECFSELIYEGADPGVIVIATCALPVPEGDCGELATNEVCMFGVGHTVYNTGVEACQEEKNADCVGVNDNQDGTYDTAHCSVYLTDDYISAPDLPVKAKCKVEVCNSAGDEDGDGYENCFDVDCSGETICKGNKEVLIKQAGEYSDPESWYKNNLGHSAEAACSEVEGTSCGNLLVSLFESDNWVGISQTTLNVSCWTHFQDYESKFLGDGTPTPLLKIKAVCYEDNCGDTLDNDGDGLHDCWDMDCLNSLDCLECNADSDCDDGFECNNVNKCKFNHIPCISNCSYNDECIKYPECNILGTVFMKVQQGGIDGYTNCEAISGEGNSCEEVCDNVDKKCRAGEEVGWGHCLPSTSCGIDGEGVCVGPGNGKEERFEQFDQMSCLGGDGCVAINSDGTACSEPDPDCGEEIEGVWTGATCGEGDGIVWGCSFLRCKDDGSCMADVNGETCSNPIDPDCGDATCLEGNGCVKDCAIKDPDCKIPYTYPSTNNMYTCAPDDGCTVIDPDGTPCSNPDPDCGDATCGPSNGCVTHGCNPENLNLAFWISAYNDKDCVDSIYDDEDNLCFSGNACSATDLNIAGTSCKELYGEDYEDPDCEDATCGPGDGYVTNCDPIDTDGFGINGCGENDGCFSCTQEDLDCGLATCGPDNGCVLKCESEDTDCMDIPKDPDLGWFYPLESSLNDPQAGLFGALGWALVSLATDITCEDGKDNPLNAQLSGGDGCVATSSEILQITGTDSTCEEVCEKESEQYLSVGGIKDGGYIKKEVSFVGEAQCKCFTLGEINVQNVCNPSNPDFTTDPDCGDATCLEGDGCVMNCQNPDPDCGFGRVCNGYSLMTDFSCNEPGYCECWEEVSLNSCNCCEPFETLSALCYAEDGNDPVELDHHFVSTETMSLTEFLLLNPSYVLEPCCKSYPASYDNAKLFEQVAYVPGQALDFDTLYNIFNSQPNTESSRLITCSRGEDCDDGIDNDGDYLTDCEDPDCDGEWGQIKSTTTYYCYNTFIDGFGYDPQCYSQKLPNDQLEMEIMGADGETYILKQVFVEGMGGDVNTKTGICQSKESDCDDKFDNDRDGKIDCADPDCVGQPSSKYWPTLGALCEYPEETLCYDGKDNDGDYESYAWNEVYEEWQTVLNPKGGIDCDDDDCTKGTEIYCSNGEDDDCDGLIDCLDPDCNGKTCDDLMVCSNKVCSGVKGPGQVAIQEKIFVQIFSYKDLLEELNKCQLKTGTGACNIVCGTQTCIFADGGRNSCSEEGSTKCTCC